MNDETGAFYLKPWQLNETVIGLGGIGKVLKSSHPEYECGDYIQGALFWPWKRFFNVNVEEMKDSFEKVCSSLNRHFAVYPYSMNYIRVT